MSCARLPSDTDRGCAESRGQGGDTLTTTRRGKAVRLPVLHFVVPEHQPHAEHLDTVSGPGQFSKDILFLDARRRVGDGSSPGNHCSAGGRVAPELRQALLANSVGERLSGADIDELSLNTGAVPDLASIPCSHAYQRLTARPG